MLIFVNGIIKMEMNCLAKKVFNYIIDSFIYLFILLLNIERNIVNSRKLEEIQRSNLKNR